MPNIVRDPIDPRISLWHFLSYYLRFMREKQGLSLTQWGGIICASRSSVSNMEAGRHRIQEDHVRLIDKHFQTGGLFQLLLWYACRIHNPDWLKEYNQYEVTSDAIRIYHGQAIPAHLQTDDYTRALLQAEGGADIDGPLAERVARNRAILDRANPPVIWALMDESVLAWPVGGREVMREQLQHLLKMADQWHVIVRIVPTASGPHPGIDGPFQIIGLESRDVAYSGAQIGGRLVESPGETKELSARFDRIGAKAASEDGSRALIEHYLERFS